MDIEKIVSESFSTIQDAFSEAEDRQQSWQEAADQIIAEGKYLQDRLIKEKYKNFNIGNRVSVSFYDIGTIVGTISALSIEEGIKLIDCEKELCSPCYNNQTLIFDSNNSFVVGVELIAAIKNIDKK